MVAENRNICRRCQKSTTAEPLRRLDLVVALCANCQDEFLKIEWQWAEDNYRRSIGVFDDKFWRTAPPSAGDVSLH